MIFYSAIENQNDGCDKQQDIFFLKLEDLILKIFTRISRSLFYIIYGKLGNLCFLIGYQLLTGQRTFFALGSFLEITRGHVTVYAIIFGRQKLKVYNFQI